MGTDSHAKKINFELEIIIIIKLINTIKLINIIKLIINIIKLRPNVWALCF
jgi:hypothetical protein